MIKSYEIEFIGEKNIADILKEALRINSRIYEFEELQNGFRIKLNGARKRLVIVCRGKSNGTNCITIVNSTKLPENGKIAINADKIARNCGSIPEVAMLGAMAKLGVVDIKTLMGVIYKNMGYIHTVAVKKGYEEMKY